MAVKTLVHTIPNITGLIRVSVNESYSNQVSQAIILARSTTLSLGDSINFRLGFSTGTTKVFTGFVRVLSKDLVTGVVTITCEDEFTKAVDFFIAADKPDDPFSRQDIKTEILVSDLLALASITSFSASVPLEVIWGTNGSVAEFNLVTVANAVRQLADALAWTVYADRNGTVILEDRKPFVVGGDSASFTWSLVTDNILSNTRSESTDNLRNRIVVYGTTDVTASAQAVSPFLPPGFFKAAVLASPLFTDTVLAQIVADENLILFNRLTENATVMIEGDPDVRPRLFADITVPFTGMSGLWFIYSVEHTFDNTSGYTQNVTLTR